MSPRVIVEPGRHGGWDLIVLEDPGRRRHFTRRDFAERVAVHEAAERRAELVVRDAYHRVLVAQPAAPAVSAVGRGADADRHAT